MESERVQIFTFSKILHRSKTEKSRRPQAKKSPNLRQTSFMSTTPPPFLVTTQIDRSDDYSKSLNCQDAPYYRTACNHTSIYEMLRVNLDLIPDMQAKRTPAAHPRFGQTAQDIESYKVGRVFPIPERASITPALIRSPTRSNKAMDRECAISHQILRESSSAIGNNVPTMAMHKPHHS